MEVEIVSSGMVGVILLVGFVSWLIVVWSYLYQMKYRLGQIERTAFECSQRLTAISNKLLER
jgi:hypothetical protein